MSLIHKLSRLFGPRGSKVILPTLVLIFGIYFLLIPKTTGIPKFVTKRLLASTEWVFQGLEGDKKFVTKQYCNADSIKRKIKASTDPSNITCRQHVASKGACTLAEQLYRTDASLRTCGYSRPATICILKEDRNSIALKYTYECSFEQCQKYNRRNVWVWAINDKSGNLIQERYYTDEKDFQASIHDIASKTSQIGHHFLLLECTDKKDYSRQPYDFIGQFFIFPPVKLPAQKTEEEAINLNFIMVDSAARAHFYRSLPETIATFNRINTYSKSKAEVLDFELFQSVEGHTAENLHALFTGSLFPKSYEPNDRERSPVNVGEFFKVFANKGYDTFYQDDLCFDSWWGMRLDLGSPNSWREYKQKMADNHIYSSGLTSSSCKILAINNSTTPFNGPDGPLCFNGRFTAYYWLRHTLLQHRYYSRTKRRLVSFTGLSVAHEHTGKRLQSFDADLANYVRKATTMDKTLTIIFADHGNTYSHYTHAVMEGRFEQFHPAFFMVIPEGVKHTLGAEIMKNLRGNQFKLLTLLDVHKGLINLPTIPKPAGIFGSISSKRTCDDLDLRLPNLCVCEGWDVETKNDTQQISVLHFAVGQLNNKIQGYQEEIRRQGVVPKCKMLTPKSFYNVRERNSGGTLITSIDFTTESGNGATSNHDVFQVQVQSEIHRNLPSRKMKLLSYDRISKFGPYRACADADVEMRLCVCDLTKIEPPKVGDIKDLVTREIAFEFPKLIETVDVSVVKNSRILHCLYFRKISYPEVTSDIKKSTYSINYNVANVCKFPIKVTLKMEFENMKISTEGPFSQIVHPFQTLYIASAMREVPYWDSWVESETIKAEPQLN